MRYLILLFLTACQVVVTPEIVADAERMCAGQKGYKYIISEPRWITVKCNNDMTFKKEQKP